VTGAVEDEKDRGLRFLEIADHLGTDCPVDFARRATRPSSVVTGITTVLPASSRSIARIISFS